jgi:hypothetical protein
MPADSLSLERLCEALRRHGRASTAVELARVDDFVLRLPAWVASYGVARLRDSWLLWVEPASEEVEARDEHAFAVSQAVLDLPAGRYVIECVEARSGAVVARESAAAPPLVIGLPRRNTGLLVEIAPA